MTTFILSQIPTVTLPSKEYPGRVILDTDAHGAILQTITADSWQAAREKIDEEKLFRIEGEGYFPINTECESFTKDASDASQLVTRD